MTVKAILFGSIGTLVETSDFQRRAFNQAFAQAGLDWNWDTETYVRLLKKSGGQQRI
jgi:phosphoglycolate phosphatase-like HAD superfamily hydrolase